MLVSLWTAVQRRRVEFAVLRALGTSHAQVLWVLTIEYLVVVLIGLFGGAYLGLFVARRMLSFLNVTEGGFEVEPKFILQTDWAFVGASFGVVLVIFVVALLVAVRTLASSTDAQALRTE
jgi:ABC-type lipoprotein release transport system permease subunit